MSAAFSRSGLDRANRKESDRGAAGLMTSNQLPGKRDIDRITLVVGRFAIGDFFDGNSYAKDPRADFMNWAMWSSAAYDFPADLPGYTRGAVAELNRKDWAVRAGLFQVPDAPNSDILTFKTKKGGMRAQFNARTTGLVELMLKAGVRSVNHNVIRANDWYEFELGSPAWVKHRPALTNRGNVIAAWSSMPT